VHQLDIDTLRIIVRAFTSVYPGAMAVLATHSLDTPVLGLLARADGGGLSLAEVRQRLSGPRLDGAAAASGLADEWALLGMVVAGPGSLRRWSEAAPLNTDDHPVVAYRAPRITYAPDSRPRDRLFELLDGLSARPADVLADTSAVEAERLAAYWSARNRFLHAGRHVRVSADPRRMLAQVQTPLLEVLTLSPDFRPAYEPLLRLAQALEPQDPERERLLQRLEQLVPQAKTRAAVAAGGPR
jgi:spermidine synthase